MKTKFLFAALLLAFGTVKAQDTVTSAPKQQDPVVIMGTMPDMSQLPELLRELGVNLQMLTDSVNWDNFERDMEKWGEEMEEWGRKMERWGEQFEESFDSPKGMKSSKSADNPVKAIRVGGSGDVRITQSPDKFSIHRSESNTSRHYISNGTLILSGSSDYEVFLPQLEEVVMHSSGDVIGRGILKGNTLHLVVMGSGDLSMNVDYDTIDIQMSGSGDVTLQGQCKVLNAALTGSGDLKIQQLVVGESHINATGSGEAWINKSGSVMAFHQRNAYSQPHRGLLFDAHWNGFEAGLNMLIDQSAMDVYTGPNDSYATRPLRSWYFGFNIADVGIAFDRKHTAGLFTGIGLGWNNYSWKNFVRMTVEEGQLVNNLLPDDRDVKNSKFGLLYLQAPLMVEVRPVRYLYIDLGVTGGIRLAAWNRIKFADGENETSYQNYLTNLFKCDASFRIGSDNLGFFVNYALVPTFVKGRDCAKAHPLMLGFSVGF